MRTIKILDNQNKLYSEITTNASYKQQSGEFSIRTVFKGNEQYTIGNKKLSIFPGNFLVINGGTTFSREIYSDVPANTFTISYADKFLADFHYANTSTDKVLLDDPFNAVPNVAPVFLETIYPFSGDMMFNMMHLKNHFDKEEHNDLLLNEYLYYGLLNFYQLYQKEILAKISHLNISNEKTREELFKRLNNAKDYMLSNYNQVLTISEISRHACLSEIHFFRTFKQTFHCTPHQYIMQLRLNNARHMLRSTDYDVNEIVNLIGFDNASSFIRLFKERFGVTPGNFRLKTVA